MLSNSIRQLINVIPLPIAIADPNDIVIAANDTAERHWADEVPSESIMGNRLSSLSGIAEIDSRGRKGWTGVWNADGTQLKIAVLQGYLDGDVEAALMQGHLDAILDTTVDAIITIDHRGRIETFNRAATKIFGYTADEVIGKNVHVLMPEPYKAEHDDYLNNYLDTGDKKIIGIGRQVTGQRKDGSIFPMDLAVSEVKIEGDRKFTGIVRDISERLQLEKEILRISDEERSRIGQDLHDELGQMLTGIGLLTRNIERTLRSRDVEEADRIAEITNLLSKADDVARNLSHGLMPVVLDSHGLSSALQRLCQKMTKVAGIPCIFEESGTTDMANDTLSIHLYRIAQEAINNALKHGKARDVRVTLRVSGEKMRLRISDNGTGFGPDWRTGGGMGVRIMQHRASIVGGSLDISSNVDFGTVVTCTIPI